MGPPGTGTFAAAAALVTAALADPVMPVKHAAPVRAAAASTVVKIRFVCIPTPSLGLNKFAQVETTFKLFSRFVKALREDAVTIAAIRLLPGLPGS
jgi:hypothetical protein